MSRYNPHLAIAPVLAAAEEWKNRALRLDGSVFFPDKALWTETNIGAVRTAFTRNLDTGEGSFLEKLERQFAQSSAESKQLMSEMIWLLLLVQMNILPATKREQIRTVWGLSGTVLPPDHPLLSDAVLVGIANPGIAFNTQRWRELVFLIDIIVAFKSLSASERTRLLDDPWAFSSWLPGVPREGYRQLRHILKYFLFPDTFERVFTGRQKQSIVRAFLGKTLTEVRAMTDEQLDRSLVEIRKKEEQALGTKEFDFYQDLVLPKWRDDEVREKLDPEEEAHEEADRRTNVWVEKSHVRNRPDRQQGENRLGSALWSPQRARNGADIYGAMRTARKGDVVLHLTDNEAITGVSIVDSDLDESFQGLADTDWADQPCYRLALRDFIKLEPPLPRKEFFDHAQTAVKLKAVLAKSSAPLFYNSDMELNQGAYLTQAPGELVMVLDEAYERISGRHLPHLESIRSIEPAHPINDGINTDALLQDLFTDRAEVDRILRIWRHKSNIILQGAPGVGKSFMAKRLAQVMAESEDDDVIEMIQFHQSYTYEDFLQGYRPNGAGFELRNGVFYSFCERARSRPDQPHIFIIDEINRGNLSKIFGELMLLMEGDKRAPEWSVRLTYSPTRPKFYIPPNVYLMGLMNTADRSLSVVDYALRRRFSFVDLPSQVTSRRFAQYLMERGAPPELITRLQSEIGDLNTAIGEDSANLGRGYVIGHSFFCPRPGQAINAQWYQSILEVEILPLLEEYWFDRPETVKQWRLRLLGG